MEASTRRAPKDCVNQFRDWLGSSLGSRSRRAEQQDFAMPPPPLLDRIPSPPLVPGEAPIDVEHLARMTLGDDVLRREVLAMFLEQTADLLDRLAARPGEGAALAHTLKGSARAIGAFGVAACAAALEGAIRRGGDPSPALAELNAVTADARSSIEAILARP
jgi:HPt (histidine-containing phosphotransfer) domain-containing protein